MLFTNKVQSIVDNITYKDGWIVHFKKDAKRGSRYIQLENTLAICSVTKEKTGFVSGKRYLSEFMTDQEIIGVIFSLIETAEVHELREFFRYKGASIYNPHLDPEALVEVAKKQKNFVLREDSMTNA